MSSTNPQDILKRINSLQDDLGLNKGEVPQAQSTHTKKSITSPIEERDDFLFDPEDLLDDDAPRKKVAYPTKKSQKGGFSPPKAPADPDVAHFSEETESKHYDPVAMGLQGLTKAKEDEEIDTSEFEIILKEIQTTKKNILITGKAGTGKSTFLRYLLSNSKKSAVVVAPTGIAAINVGGQTIHSLFGLKPEIQIPEHIKPNWKRKAFFKKLDVLIIDEISMVRADVLDAIDFLLRTYRDIDYPFGAIQVIMFGDLFQLPPVVSKSEEQVFSHLYPESPYFFSSNVMKEQGNDFIHVELSKIYRQQDEAFISVLNKIRRGGVGYRTLAPINARADDRSFNEKDCITLTTTKDLASYINQSRLEEIKKPEFFFDATISGDFDEKHYPTDGTLLLKEGAQVMMIKNDPDGRWVNGSIGTVMSLDKSEIQIKIKDNVHSVPQEKWEKIKYELTGSGNTASIDRVPVGTFVQYPLKLAWAVTIHKSQGLTFDKVIIDMGRGGFAHGQTYVALSRCKTLEGIKLSRLISPSDVIVDKRIAKFFEKTLEKKQQDREKNENE